ncbi:MAG: hypothetical protein QW146_05615 [Candidatus Bathyarchaeia archaeon]
MNTTSDDECTGKCVDYSSSLELYEIDFDKGKRIMQCTRCGLYHFYKEDFLGNGSLLKPEKFQICGESKMV